MQHQDTSGLLERDRDCHASGGGARAAVISSCICCMLGCTGDVFAKRTPVGYISMFITAAYEKSREVEPGFLPFFC